MKPVTSFTLNELEELCLKSGEKKYRAKQILEWIYKKGITDFSQMTNLSKEIQTKFAKQFIINSSKIKRIAKSKDKTTKLLIELADKKCIETVVIPDDKRNTLCISTQVGCPVKCSFCASGKKGLIRSLEPNEIVEQILLAQTLLNKSRVTNIVIMGMGEPFLNYDNLVKALDIVISNWGMNIGKNKITLSTVGIPEKIEHFSQDKNTVHLAISLHAPDDKTRKQIIPLATKYNIKSIIESAKKYSLITKKDLTFEYLLLDGVNTSQSQAEALAKLIKPTRGKINLISYNEVENIHYKTPSEKTIEAFQTILLNNGIITILRKSRGTDINAACGQLALTKGHI